MITRRNRALTLAGCGLLVLCLLVCGCPRLLFTVGERKLYWNGMYTRQEGSRFNPKGITSFSQLYYRPETGTPAITIRMPDGKFILANNLNQDTLAVYLTAGTAHKDQYATVVSYSRGDVTVYLDEHGAMELIIVDINPLFTRSDIQGKPPAISTPDGNTVLEFPLQEKELEDLFGKPTKDETGLFAT